MHQIMRRHQHDSHEDASGNRRRLRHLALGALAVMAGLAGFLAAVPAQAAGGVIIYKVQYNSPGTDDRANPASQRVRGSKNTAGTTRTITGWKLREASGPTYTFPATRVAAGNYLYVGTGRGTNTTRARYWGSGNYIWNNSGDTAYLRNGSGTLIDSCKWGSTGKASSTADLRSGRHRRSHRGR